MEQGPWLGRASIAPCNAEPIASQPGTRSGHWDGDHRAQVAGNRPSEGLFLNEKVVNKTPGFLLENYFAKQKSNFFTENSKHKTIKCFCQIQVFPRFTL